MKFGFIGIGKIFRCVGIGGMVCDVIVVCWCIIVFVNIFKKRFKFIKFVYFRLLLNDSFVLRNEFNSYWGCICVGFCVVVVCKFIVIDIWVVFYCVFIIGYVYFKFICVDIVIVVVGFCVFIFVYNN